MNQEFTTKKLPILQTLMQVLSVIKQRYVLFLIYAIPYFSLLLLVYFIQPAFIDEVTYKPTTLFYMFFIVQLAILCIVIVSFHRIFIMDLTDVKETNVMRFSIREWRYLGWYLAIAIFVGTIYFVLMLAVSGFLIHSTPQTIYSIIIMIVVPLAYLASRWILVLPAASVDDTDASLSFAWNLSLGNGWRLTLLIFGLPALLNYILNYILGSGNVIISIIGNIMTLILATIGIGVISLSYAYLKPDGSETV